MGAMLETSTTVATAKVRWADAAAGVYTGRALFGAFRRIGVHLQREIMRSASGDLLKKRTGNLTRAVFYRVEGDERSQSLLVRAGVDLLKAIYGRIHNFGGIIRASKAKFLTIPVGPNVTGKGVMRVSAREFISNPGSLGFTGSFVNRRKTAILGVRGDGSIEPVFALKKEVRIARTGYISDQLRNNDAFIRGQLGLVQDEIIQEITK